MTLVRTDFEHFKNWLDLDINSIAWEGRYADSFSGFWESFFKDKIEPMELGERFNYAKKIAKSGPLISWLNWLFEKFVAFSFIHQGRSVREIAFQFDLQEKYISTVLRDHLIKVYPAYEDYINENFQISNVSSKNLFLKFEDLEPVLGAEAKNKGTFEDDILAHMEVTLYPDWPNLVKELRKDMLSLKVDFENFKKKTAFRKQLRFFQEVIILLLILSVIIFALKNTNKLYEDYLVNKITLFEPNFFWLDKTLSYQEQDLLAKQQIDLSNKELEELERIEAQQVFTDERLGSRYDPESDVVVLDSVENVPKSFGEAETERSEYEETQKGGYRDSSYASSNKKAYRILMASVEPSAIRERILPLMKKYGIAQVDNVKPGMQIPGGLYFNLMVPSNNLKDFMTKVSTLGEATIFESRSQGGDQAGKNRVFIWVKSI
ncbi:hypothetical protein ACJVC5_06440 [Peredibacter sp. HCB2-198]|uniref:hypothetical protein n=1 Tax=Peredibacter sp. HCB2-198 TaxID=3383025 RepID=UPI0038B620A7